MGAYVPAGSIFSFGARLGWIMFLKETLLLVGAQIWALMFPIGGIFSSGEHLRWILCPGELKRENFFW